MRTINDPQTAHAFARGRKTPTAMEVREERLVVEFGPYTVRYQYDSMKQNDRFKWLVHGPPGPDGVREGLDDFATYREAVRDAQARSRGEFGEERGDDRHGRTVLQRMESHERAARHYAAGTVGRKWHEAEAARISNWDAVDQQARKEARRGSR